MYSQPFGFLLTWTTYGTWLHGKNTGSVDKFNNIYGKSFIKENLDLMHFRTSIMSQKPFFLNEILRIETKNFIIDICQHNKYSIYAGHILPNHIHIVVNGQKNPDDIMKNIKSWCTRKLLEKKLINRNNKIWTKGGSTIYLWTEHSVKYAVNYVLKKQNGEFETIT